MTIPTNEVIKTTRCRLRYPSREDFDFIWSASRYSGFNDGMVWDPPSSIEELTEPLERNQAAWEAGTSFTWTIETKEAGEFLGRIALRQTEPRNYWSLGYWIHPESQGLGFASEAGSAVVDFGFSRLDAVCITAAHATWNDASGKVLQNIGMKKTGLNPRGFMKRGEWVAEYEYEIRK